MKLLKKVTSTTIAATLVAGGLTGVLVSRNGIAGILGTQQVSASTTLPASAATLKARMTKVRDKLVATGNMALVNTAKTELSGQTSNLDTLLGPIWVKITNKAASAGKSPTAIDDLKVHMFTIAGIISGLDYATTGIDDLNTIRETYYNDFKFLADITGFPTPDFEDVTAFVAALETQMGSLAVPVNIGNPSNLLSDTVENTLETVLNTSNTNTAKIIRAFGITKADLAVAKTNFFSSMPNLKQASLAIAAAYLSVLNDEKTPTATPTPTPTPTPPPVVTIPTPTPTTTQGITPKDLETTLVDVQKQVTDLLKNIPDVTKITDENRDQILKALETAIEKVGTLDLSKTVEIKGDVATPKLDENALAKEFANIKTNTDKINEKAPSGLSKEDKPKVTATIDLGTVNSKTTEIPISKNIIDQAKANGIDSIAVKVNGVTLSFDLKDLKSDTKLSIQKQDTTTATNVTDKKLATDVFTFEVSSQSGGTSSAPTFSTPVIVKIPIKTTDGLDTELLVLAKIIDGKLEYYGGKYNAEGKTFEAERNSFSTYTVVENKIVFNDLASVKDWAGRQVQVVAAKGLVEGRAEGSFVPNEQVTRAEFAKMLVKAFNLEDASAKENFKDVNDSDWFAPYVAAAAKVGIINGRTDDQFAPSAPVTRAEMATMAARALKIAKAYSDADIAVSLKGFKDATSIADSLKAGVALAASKGIVIGESEGQFNPNGVSTRAQAAVVLYRLINK